MKVGQYLLKVHGWVVYQGQLPFDRAEAAYYRLQQRTRVIIVLTYCLLSVGRRSTMKSQLTRAHMRNVGHLNGRDRYETDWEVRVRTDSSPALSAEERNETPERVIALWRIYLLRAGYLLIAIGMGMQKIPAFLHHRPWELMHGVVNSMLLALVLLAVLGLRYPLKMLPLLFWEIAWKATWLLAVALPAWQNHTMDADTWDTTFACLMSVIFLFVVPWDYVWRNFVAARGDRWR